ncbi:TetR/AcrR family transcriptional regulator [Sphingomonas endolithica]|uniref:TetR/AcrR family transcriptional regulator n=1 Tax=Sphingomonas endolithica TaxID=2972485 RepID=UPI0021B03420|nr:TetR/AcrR family transcriptional regulator [Sphingomonas sp. ZFBP2030]
MKRAETIEQTRRKLIAAARKAFARDGYHAASMDQLTAEVGLTRGALYHHFGSKRGLMEAVVEQIDTEMASRLREALKGSTDKRQALLDEGVAYIKLALEPEFQRIVLRDGPAVLGAPMHWPSQNACLAGTIERIEQLVDAGEIAPVDAEAAARLLDGAVLDAAMWIAASDEPATVAQRAIDAFIRLASGLIAR